MTTKKSAQQYKMTNLTADLYRHAKSAGSGKPTSEKTKLLALVAGKIIGCKRVEIDYARERKEKPEISDLQ
jgi:hypothetical protein